MPSGTMCSQSISIRSRGFIASQFKKRCLKPYRESDVLASEKTARCECDDGRIYPLHGLGYSSVRTHRGQSKDLTSTGSMLQLSCVTRVLRSLVVKTILIPDYQRNPRSDLLLLMPQCLSSADRLSHSASIRQAMQAIRLTTIMKFVPVSQRLSSSSRPICCSCIIHLSFFVQHVGGSA